MGMRYAPYIEPEPELPPKQVCPLDDHQLTSLLVHLISVSTAPMRSGTALYAYQIAFIYRVIHSLIIGDVATITALFSRQSGKTEAVASLALGMAIFAPALANAYPDDPRLMKWKGGFYVGIFAPIAKQALFSYDRVKKVLNSAQGQELLNDEDLNLEVMQLTSTVCALSNGSKVSAQSASPDTNIEGDTLHLCICDEAHKLSRSKVEHDIRPMMAATGGTMVKIGTAWMSRGGFHTDITNNLEILKRTGVRNHFEYAYKAVLKEKAEAYKRDNNPFHLQYQKFIDAEKLRLGGTTSEEFKMNFELKWQEANSMAISQTTLRRGRREELGLGAGARGGVVVAALDVAKSEDSSVVTILHIDTARPIMDVRKPNIHDDKSEQDNVYYPKTVLGLKQLQGNFEGEEGQYQTVIDFLCLWPVSHLIVDATSMGDPVYERFDALLSHMMKVHAFKYSLQSKSDLYKYYLQEWTAGRIFYPFNADAREAREIQEFEAQHENLEKEYSSQGYMMCQAIEGEHDDFPDSCAMAVSLEKELKVDVLPDVVVRDFSNTRMLAERMAAASNAGTVNIGGLSFDSPQDFQREAKRMYGREHRYIGRRR